MGKVNSKRKRGGMVLDDLFDLIKEIEPDRNGCLNWTKNTSGTVFLYNYNEEIARPKQYRVARLLMETILNRRVSGSIKKRCKNPRCVNLEHLFEEIVEAKVQPIKREKQKSGRRLRYVIHVETGNKYLGLKDAAKAFKISESGIARSCVSDGYLGACGQHFTYGEPVSYGLRIA